MSEIADDVVAAHRRIADALEQLGPVAPGGVGDWTASDLAAHLMWQRAAGGLLVYPARLLLGRGFRVNRVSGSSSNRLDERFRRKGFAAATEAVRRGPPPLLLRDAVVPVALFEVWLHHDDLCRANGIAPPVEPATLGRAVDFAIRAQRKALGSTPVDRRATNGDLLRWLAGRPSPLPPHSPPLSF